jgi:hypothetical protein
MYVLTAMLWTVLLIGQIIDASNGGQPTWFDVFIPLTCMVINDWVDAANHHQI